MNNLFIISGPSGVGKSTLIDYILQTIPQTKLSVSCTTRSPRYYESDGREYYFVMEHKFREMIQNDEFIEYTYCFGNYYGTPKSEIDNILKNNGICILDVEFAGAARILKQYRKSTDTQCTSILIMPPSIIELKNRLLERGSENEQAINCRLAEFNSEELAYYEPIYDYIITNSNLKTTKETILDIFNKSLRSSQNNLNNNK